MVKAIAQFGVTAESFAKQVEADRLAMCRRQSTAESAERWPLARQSKTARSSSGAAGRRKTMTTNDQDILNYAAQVAAFYNHLVFNGVNAEHARDLTDRYMANVTEMQLEMIRLRAAGTAPVLKANGNGGDR